MAEMHSPTIARMLVRQALRAAREAAGLTQGQVATALEWSLSKVVRIETGRVTVSVTDLQALCALYGVTAAEVDDLAERARRAQADRWRRRGAVADEFTAFEADAVRRRYFDARVIPGLLQTEEYATRLALSWRRTAVPPTFHVVLDESVLHRVVGGPLLMARQLVDLLRVMRDTDAEVQILPLDAAPVLGCASSFCLLEQDTVRLFRGLPPIASAAVDLHVAAFEAVVAAALDHDETVHRISEHIARYLRLATPARPRAISSPISAQ